MANPTWYVWIKGMQDGDQDMGVDPLKRQTYGFNVSAQRSVAPTSPGGFEDELAALLVAGGLGLTAATNLFIGAKARVPDGDGPYVTIVSTGGLAPEATQSAALAYRNPSAQVKVHAKNPSSALALSLGAFAVLASVRNRAVTA